ncbi:MAG: UDP-N-acetylglucosamine 2-epimerase (non-hydrolyzing) [Thermoanaerobaculaceae bacterium]|nr:UDP-N-acetylglucosamine 2-epimerase (non-hydrolyzing) [Thermoanaerobaculaceae bacterium]
MNIPVIVTIVGARPQFIKAVALSKALEKMRIKEIIIHTGQHYDYEMSQIFFDTLGLKEPKYHLEIGSLSHGAQTGRMVEKIEEVLLKEKPKGVIVYGDTNSTLAGALASVKLHIPVFHIEAGLRSFNRTMPEEINRVLTDHISTLLFAPSDSAVRNLKKEGLQKGVYRTGDIMLDTYLMFKKKFEEHSKAILKKYELKEKQYGIVTIHREENTNDKDKFNSILKGLEAILKEGMKLIFPVHPRIRNIVPDNIEGLIITKPMSYLNTQALLSKSAVVLTDSGGIQKEAYFHKVPCVTLRNETEWVELNKKGVNLVAGTSPDSIKKCFHKLMIKKLDFSEALYGDGKSGKFIANCIKSYLEEM